jgi:hypothetical protein
MPTECSADLFGFASVDGRRVEASFDGGAISSDGGAVLLGATDRAIGLVDRFAACFRDSRQADVVEHEVRTLVGQRVFGLALGYEDLNDHDWLRHDPVMAVLVGKLAARRRDCAPAAGKSTLNRLELSRPEPTRYHKIGHDPAAIEALLVDIFLEAHASPPEEIVLDLDATDDPIHGEQEGRFFHGYYGGYCYLPLYVFCGRHLLAAKLRRSNIDGAAGAVEEVARLVEQIRARWPAVRIVLRADSGFAREALMAWCEENRVDYLFGLARNVRLVEQIESELAEAAAESAATGAPARRFKDFPWTTRDSWSCHRRVVGKAEHTRGEANPRFVVTSLGQQRADARALYEDLYCARGESGGVTSALWRTASRNASSIFSPTAPRRPPCGPTSFVCGSPRWPTCCSKHCAASPSRRPSSPTPPAAPSDSSSSRSAPWSASRSAASKSPWPPLIRGAKSGAGPTPRSAPRADTNQTAHRPHPIQGGDYSARPNTAPPRAITLVRTIAKTLRASSLRRRHRDNSSNGSLH